MKQPTAQPGPKPPRYKSRDVILTFRITAAGAAAIDDLRGSWSRSEWARRALAAAATAQPPLRGPDDKVTVPF